MFSDNFEGKYRPGRIQTINFPGGVDGEPYRSITFRSADGLILYLLKRIEKLEERVSTSEMRANHAVLSAKIKKHG